MLKIRLKLDMWISSKLWPSYPCQDCIGMREHGCYCSHYGAYWPGGGQPWWVEFCRDLYKVVSGRRD